MSLNPGARLGPYEVTGPIGAGGMGEVDKARDTRLDRTVAIKVLPAQFAADSRFRERFEREAKAISQLSHPHICMLHDVGRQDEIDYLVMEYLEGQTLAQRLYKGALPLDQALRYAVQIADALDRAHRQGIVHRDLKPGNIMLTKSGAKLLDFGLAKASGRAIRGSSSSMVPTTVPMTAQGTILGTLQYMAPEQLQGKDADTRSDIFSFGAITCEMVTGKRVFEGSDGASVIAAILDHQPAPMSTLQPLTPPALDRVVNKCLAKDPDDRWQTARDLHDELKWIAERGSGAILGASPRPSRTPIVLAYAAAAAVVATAATVFAFRMLDRQPAAVPTVRMALAAPQGEAFGRSAAVSPDGRWLAFIGSSAGQGMLWVRALNALESHPLAGTTDATFPFWSPDSSRIGFFADGKLKTIEARGSPPVPLCDAYNGRGGTWAADGTIIFALGFNDPLYRVAESGGDCRPLTTLDSSRGESAHRWPWFLPDGRHFVFLVRSVQPDVHGIYVGSIDSSDRVRLIDADSNVQYVRPGYLLFTRGQILTAQAFDVRTLRVTGTPQRIAEGLRYAGSGTTYGFFSASDTDTLVYALSDSPGGSRLVWIDRGGKEIRQVGESRRPYAHLALSPDAHHIAVQVAERPGVSHIWLNRLPGADVAPFTFGQVYDTVAVWSRTGKEILWASARPGVGFYRRPFDGSGTEQIVWRTPGTRPNEYQPTDWSSDGRHLLFQRAGKDTGWDLWVLPLFGDREPERLIQTPADDGQGQFSPDGRWVAYASNESGQLEVYVQSFPSPGVKSRVSVAGGMLPTWRADGRELFFLEPRTGRMMVADVATGGNFQSSKPQFLFQLPVGLTHGSEAGGHYGVSPDGQRFLVGLPPNESLVHSLNVVVHWSSDLPR